MVLVLGYSPFWHLPPQCHQLSPVCPVPPYCPQPLVCPQVSLMSPGLPRCPQEHPRDIGVLGVMGCGGASPPRTLSQLSPLSPPCSSLYTGGTLLVAFSTPGETPWALGGTCWGPPLSPLTHMSPGLAVLLFPAMSMLSVGGILLILTNMQVSSQHPDPHLVARTPGAGGS